MCFFLFQCTLLTITLCCIAKACLKDISGDSGGKVLESKEYYVGHDS